MIAHKLSQPATRVEAEHELNTRRYPRTCEEAWGSYNRSTSCLVVPMEVVHPMHMADKAIFLIGVGVIVAWLLGIVL